MNSSLEYELNRQHNETISYPQSVPLPFLGQKGLFLGWKTITPILLEETQRFVQSFFTVHKAVEGGTPIRME